MARQQGEEACGSVDEQESGEGQSVESDGEDLIAQCTRNCMYGFEVMWEEVLLDISERKKDALTCRLKGFSV